MQKTEPTTPILMFTLAFRRETFESICFNTLFLLMKKWRPTGGGDWPRAIHWGTEAASKLNTKHECFILKLLRCPGSHLPLDLRRNHRLRRPAGPPPFAPPDCLANPTPWDLIGDITSSRKLSWPLLGDDSVLHLGHHAVTAWPIFHRQSQGPHQSVPHGVPQ